MAQPIRHLFGGGAMISPPEEISEQRRQSQITEAPLHQMRQAETLNQSNNVAPQMGEITFYQNLSSISRDYLEKNKRAFQETSVTNSLINIQADLTPKSLQYLQERPDGAGYTEYMSSLYSSAYQTAADNAPDSEVGSAILNFGNKHFNGELNSWSKEERSRTDAYLIDSNSQYADVIANQVRMSPADSKKLSECLDGIYKTLEGRLSPLEFEKFKKEHSSEFAFQYASALIERNPFNASQILNSNDMFKSLDPRKFDSLLRYGETKVNEAVKLKKDLARIEEIQYKNNSNLQASRIDLAIREATSIVDVPSAADIRLIPGIEEKKQNELVGRANYKRRMFEKQNEGLNKVADRIAGAKSLADIESSNQNKYYESAVDQTLPLKEKVSFLINMKASQPIRAIQNDFATYFDNNNSQQMLESARAIRSLTSAGRSKILNGMEDKYIRASRFIESKIGPNASDQEIKTACNSAYQKFINIDEAVVSSNREAYKKIPLEKRDRMLRNVVNSFATEGGIFGLFKHVDPNIQNKLMSDAKGFMQNAFEAGQTEEKTLVKDVLQSMSSIWGISKINGDPMAFKNPLEYSYPGTNPKVFHESRDSALSQIIDSYSQAPNLNFDEIKASKPGEIEITEAGKRVTKKVFIEPSEINPGMARLYYEKLGRREYLRAVVKRGEGVVLDYSPTEYKGVLDGAIQ